jgi:hypothetical protein
MSRASSCPLCKGYLCRTGASEACPTLVLRLGEPVLRIIGPLADKERVLVGLGLRPSKI